MERLVGLLALVFLAASIASAHPSSGALSVSGSTGLLFPATLAAHRMDAEGVKVHVLAGGSLFGLDLVRAGQVDLALSEVPPGRGLWGRRIGTVRVMVVAHPGTGIREMSLGDLRAVLAGAVTNWAQLGGRRRPLVLIFRTAPSGLRLELTERLLGAGESVVARSVNALSNGDVAQGVRRTPGAVGFLEGRWAPKGLKVLRVDGLDPDAPNYPLTLPVYAALRRPPGPAARRYLGLVEAGLR